MSARGKLTALVIVTRGTGSEGAPLIEVAEPLQLR